MILCDHNSIIFEQVFFFFSSLYDTQQLSATFAELVPETANANDSFGLGHLLEVQA